MQLVTQYGDLGRGPAEVVAIGLLVEVEALEAAVLVHLHRAPEVDVVHLHLPGGVTENRRRFALADLGFFFFVADSSSDEESEATLALAAAAALLFSAANASLASCFSF